MQTNPATEQNKKTTDRIFEKILLQMYIRTRKSPLKFGSHPDLEFGYKLLIRIGLVLAEVCALQVSLL